jgi:hypothetical protein
MRTERLQRTAAALLLATLAWPASARTQGEDTKLAIEIRAQNTLPRSAHLGIAVIVTTDTAAHTPLLLTPHVEGEAVELVRGRLLRSDAKVMDATHLRFEVPVVARSEGTAILRVEVASFECSPACRRVVQSESRALRVQ